MARVVVAIAIAIAACALVGCDACGKKASPVTASSSAASVHAYASSLEELSCDEGKLGRLAAGSSSSSSMRGEITATPIPLADPIARAICADMTHLHACWHDAHSLDPGKPSDDFRASIEVDHGHVQAAHAVTPPTNPPFSQCVLTDFVQLKLPADVPSGTATYTLHLPHDDGAKP